MLPCSEFHRSWKSEEGWAGFLRCPPRELHCPGMSPALESRQAVCSSNVVIESHLQSLIGPTCFMSFGICLAMWAHTMTESLRPYCQRSHALPAWRSPRAITSLFLTARPPAVQLTFPTCLGRRFGNICRASSYITHSQPSNSSAPNSARTWNAQRGRPPIHNPRFFGQDDDVPDQLVTVHQKWMRFQLYTPLLHEAARTIYAHGGRASSRVGNRFVAQTIVDFAGSQAVDKAISRAKLDALFCVLNYVSPVANQSAVMAFQAKFPGVVSGFEITGMFMRPSWNGLAGWYN